MIYESRGRRLDVNRIRANMKSEGRSNIGITEKPREGEKYLVEIYYEADIPISKSLATKIAYGQNLEIAVLQEVQDENGQWINVDKTLPTMCEADKCSNPVEMTAYFEKNGKKDMHLICKHHANLLSSGVSFNLKTKDKRS